MNDQELDAAIRRLLLDSVERRMRAIDLNDVPQASPSPRHQAQMRAMLQNPLKWARHKARPVWLTVLRRAAAFLLAVLLGLGVVAFSIPSARAAMVRWFIEWRDATHWAYRYTGEAPAEDIPEYTITALPEGFVETERREHPASVSVVYENSAGDVIYLDYHYMFEGTLAFYGAENSDIYDVEVNHMHGQYTESQLPGAFNGITWIDEEANIQFDITSVFGRDSIMHMAESISLVETPK